MQDEFKKLDVLTKIVILRELALEIREHNLTDVCQVNGLISNRIEELMSLKYEFDAKNDARTDGTL